MLFGQCRASAFGIGPTGLAGFARPGADLMLARFLVAWGDAFITGMLVAIFVAFRPEWLATYTDRLYLPTGDKKR